MYKKYAQAFGFKPIKHLDLIQTPSLARLFPLREGTIIVRDDAGGLRRLPVVSPYPLPGCAPLDAERRAGNAAWKYAAGLIDIDELRVTL
jgi:hypothetical protein